jgi:hypothetical protein
MNTDYEDRERLLKTYVEAIESCDSLIKESKNIEARDVWHYQMEKQANRIKTDLSNTLEEFRNNKYSLKRALMCMETYAFRLLWMVNELAEVNDSNENCCEF